MAAIRPEIRIAILDDHAVVRFGVISELLKEPDFTVVGNYETSRSMITGLRAAPADILLVDFALAPTEVDGVSLIRALRIKVPDSRIVVFSSHFEPAVVALALRYGAQGFVGKNQPMGDVIKAIRTVASGGIYLDDDMSYRLAETSTQNIIDHTTTALDANEQLISGAKLSTKEREVIRCFLDGMTVSQIAEKFDRSPKTISTQKGMAFRKLGITTDNELFKIRNQLDEL